jgi:hypothetical protein
MSGPHPIDINGVCYSSREQARLATGIDVNALASQARRTGKSLSEVVDGALARKAAREDRKRREDEARRQRAAEAAARAAEREAERAEAAAQRLRPVRRLDDKRARAVTVFGTTYATLAAASAVIGINVARCAGRARTLGCSVDEAVIDALARAGRAEDVAKWTGEPVAPDKITTRTVDERLPPAAACDCDWSVVRALAAAVLVETLREAKEAPDRVLAEIEAGGADHWLAVVGRERAEFIAAIERAVTGQTSIRRVYVKRCTDPAAERIAA